jgi:hypothetical protein
MDAAQPPEPPTRPMAGEQQEVVAPVLHPPFYLRLPVDVLSIQHNFVEPFVSIMDSQSTF